VVEKEVRGYRKKKSSKGDCSSCVLQKRKILEAPREGTPIEKAELRGKTWPRTVTKGIWEKRQFIKHNSGKGEENLKTSLTGKKLGMQGKSRLSLQAGKGGKRQNGKTIFLPTEIKMKGTVRMSPSPALGGGGTGKNKGVNFSRKRNFNEW